MKNELNNAQILQMNEMIRENIIELINLLGGACYTMVYKLTKVYTNDIWQ